MISKIFTEVIIAPNFELKAKDLLSKKNLILITYKRSKKIPLNLILSLLRILS